MASLADPQIVSKMNFPGPLGSKRRRMRSGGNAAAAISESIKQSQEENISEQKTTQTSKCKGATTIPIFLKKTYKMVDTCDPNIASWTDDGDMFVVKDPEAFAVRVIPQYFDHNKFSSFARQLNFYGFRKMQSKPIRNSDYDAGTAKHVTFYNENFRRGRCDLLKKIQRSTRGGGTVAPGDQSREISMLRDQVSALEQKVSDMKTQTEERVRRLELDMLARMEQMMLAVQQQQRAQLQLEKASSVGNINTSTGSIQSITSQMPQGNGNNWDPSQFSFPRGSSISSTVVSNGNSMGAQQPQFHQVTAPPTLPPHPKQKQLPLGAMPGSMAAPPDRMNSLRGISTLSRGLSGLSRGASVESSTSAVLMRNSWEDKFFSMLMLESNGEQQGANQSTDMANLSPTPINESGPVAVSDSSRMMSEMQKNRMAQMDDQDDLSDVSSSDLQ